MKLCCILYSLVLRFDTINKNRNTCLGIWWDSLQFIIVFFHCKQFNWYNIQTINLLWCMLWKICLYNMTVSNVGHCSCKCDIFMQNALGLKNLKSKQNCIPFFTNHSPIKFYNWYYFFLALCSITVYHKKIMSKCNNIDITYRIWHIKNAPGHI